MAGGRYKIEAGGRLRLISDLGRLPAGRIRVDICIEGGAGFAPRVVVQSGEPGATMAFAVDAGAASAVWSWPAAVHDAWLETTPGDLNAVRFSVTELFPWQ